MQGKTYGLSPPKTLFTVLLKQDIHPIQVAPFS